MENIPLNEISRVGKSTFFYSSQIISYSLARIRESKKAIPLLIIVQLLYMNDLFTEDVNRSI